MTTIAADSPVVTQEPSYTIYVSNLNDQINIQTLKENLYILFITYGDIIDINIDQSIRGQAFVIFSDIASASHALRAAQGEIMFGKPLKLQYSLKKSKKIEELEKLGG